MILSGRLHPLLPPSLPLSALSLSPPCRKRPIYSNFRMSGGSGGFSLCRQTHPVLTRTVQEVKPTFRASSRAPGAPSPPPSAADGRRCCQSHRGDAPAPRRSSEAREKMRTYTETGHQMFFRSWFYAELCALTRAHMRTPLSSRWAEAEASPRGDGGGGRQACRRVTHLGAGLVPDRRPGGPGHTSAHTGRFSRVRTTLWLQLWCKDSCVLLKVGHKQV